MKSWGFYFRGEYGNNFLEYPVFQNRDESTYKRLMARSSGNDFGNTQILDISTVSIIRGHVDFEYQEYKQCVLYLNGSYWGIYNIREMLTKHYFEQYFGFPKENIDFLEGSELNPIADDGNVNSYNNNVLSFIENNDLSVQENYNFIANIIDISSYIDYIIVNTYIGNRDWPNTNIKWWKDRTSSISKWRWAMFDTDMSFQLGNKEYIWIGDLIGQPFPEYDPGAISGSFFIFNNLIKNDEFKERFLNRYLYLIENTFNKERVESLILENKNRIYTEYDNFHLKWPGTKNKTEWEKSVEDIIKFNNFRHDYLKNLIQQLKYDFENQKN